MPVNASNQPQLDPSIIDITDAFSQLGDELSQFFLDLRNYLTEGLDARIFPCHISQIHGFLARIPKMVGQIRDEQQVITITGRRALVALNNFIFRRTVLEDEVFFRGRTLFVISSQATNVSSTTVKVQVYNKQRLTVHKELQFDCIKSLNEELSKELIRIDFEKEFDGLLVQINLQCPLLKRFKIVVAPKVDAMIKELLDILQHHQSNDVASRLFLMLHYFAPNLSSETDTKAAESELNYVCNMAKDSQLLLMCEHLRGRQDDVAPIAQKHATNSVDVCYYTQWQWDGLTTVQPKLESLLKEQSRRRFVKLAKTATKEFNLPFKVVHQLKQKINLCKKVANNQQRPPAEWQRDFKALRGLAEKLSDNFGRTVDSKLRDVSELIAQHLRKGQVRSRIIKAILTRAAELKGSSEHEVEITFREVVAAEIQEWNSSGHQLDTADEEVHSDKMEKYKELVNKANGIQEIVLVSDDMLNSTEHSSLHSTDSDSRASIQGIVDDMVRLRLRTGRLENFAAGIAAPLWVPLAAITMAIIAPVMGAKKGQQSDAKFQSELKGMVQDFLDKLDSDLIRTQFFAKVKERLAADAKHMREFVEYYCILPADRSLPVNSRHSETSLIQHLADLEGKLQFLHGGLMMLQVEKLGCEILRREDCQHLGVNMDADGWEQLGTELSRNKPVFLVEPPNSAQRPLVLKVAGNGGNPLGLLLEIDILKSVSQKGHKNIVAWIGTVYFPKLRTVGFLTHKYDCDLWQFMQKHESLVVPCKSPVLSSQRSAAFATCRNTCEQIFSAVHHLHSMQILHRDLKLENVLVEIESGTQPLRIVAKLCDFGLAKHESEISGVTYGGTNGYMAPEVQRSKPLFSNKSDIYALGVIAWECYFGRRLFDNQGAIKTLRTGDNQAWDFLIETMTSESPADRPLIEQCRVLLWRLDKKPDANMLLSVGSKFNRELPSLRDSLLALNRTFHG